MGINSKLLELVDYLEISQRKFTMNCGIAEGALRGKGSISVENLVNYPPTPKAIDGLRASSSCATEVVLFELSTFVIDRSSRYIFNPSFKMLTLAFKSLSCITPQELQVHSLIERFKS